MTSEDAAAQQLAEASAAAMWAADAASRQLGMELLDVGPGRARLQMLVRADMVNGHGTCHGGLVMTLADSAFAFACNSRGEVTVASGADITFVAAAYEGDVLRADAVERSRWGRSGLTDVTVVREPGGDIVAEFRGRSRSLGRPFEPPAPT